MHNLEVETLGVSEDVKMTRIFLVAQLNFFNTSSDVEQTIEDTQIEDSEGKHFK